MEESPIPPHFAVHHNWQPSTPQDRSKEFTLRKEFREQDHGSPDLAVRFEPPNRFTTSSLDHHLGSPRSTIPQFRPARNMSGASLPPETPEATPSAANSDGGSSRTRRSTAHFLNAPTPENLVNELVEDVVRQWGPKARRVTSAQEEFELRKTDQKENLIFYDGFATIWHVPMSIPPPGVGDEDAKKFSSRIDDAVQKGALAVMEEEVEEECRDMWDVSINTTRAMYKPWDEVKGSIPPHKLLQIVARNRLSNRSAMLPGYFGINILDMAPTGKFLVGFEAVPPDVTLDMLLSKLDRLDPADSTNNSAVLAIARDKLDAVVELGQWGEVINEARRLRRHLDSHPYRMDMSGSERRSWVYKLYASIPGQTKPHTFTIRRGNGPPRLSHWSQLKDAADLKKIKDGAKEGKLPVFVRKVRLRRMWPQIKDLVEHGGRSKDPSLGGDEFTPEQLTLLDGLLAEQTDAEREQNRQLAALMSLF